MYSQHSHSLKEPGNSAYCLKCHSLTNFAFYNNKNGDLSLRGLTVDTKLFSQSVHGKLTCQRCHKDIKEYPHSKAPAKVECSRCHTQIASSFAKSVHSQGLTGTNSDMPTCTTCHGAGNPHAIPKISTVVTTHDKMKLCTTCHADADLMARNHSSTEAVHSYQSTFHYKAIKFGATHTATCHDCHTSHNVLPKNNPASSIAPQHIAKTCAQAGCHKGANMNFAMSGASHLSAHIEEEPLLWFVEKFFIVLTLGTMLALCSYILLDIQKRFGWLKLGTKAVTSIVMFIGKIMYAVISKIPAMLRFLKHVLID